MALDRTENAIAKIKGNVLPESKTSLTFHCRGTKFQQNVAIICRLRGGCDSNHQVQIKCLVKKVRKEKKLLHLSARYGSMFQENILIGHFTKSGETLEIREKFQQLGTRPIFGVHFKSSPEEIYSLLFPRLVASNRCHLLNYLHSLNIRSFSPCDCPIVVILEFPSLVMRILENYIGITVIGPQESSQGSHQISAFIYVIGYLTLI